MEEVRTRGFIRSHERKECDSCIFMKWVGSGSRSQQLTYCTKIEPNFLVCVEDVCDEFEDFYNT
jgi:hypothetical protein